jgi:hypothetical protein
MDQQRFDRFTRAFSGGASRRNVLRSLAASALTGAAFTVGGRRTLAARLQGLDPDEQAVVLYEGLAGVVDQHDGNCAELAEVVRAYLDDNADALNQLDTSLTADNQPARRAAAEQYGDRMEAATATIQFGRIRCAYRGGSPDGGLLCPEGGTATPVASYMPNARRALAARAAALQDSCDCAGDCPMSAGWCVVSVAECIFGGTPCECCWTSYCGSYDHCMTDCQANDCCTGTTCSSPNPPDTGG